MSQNDDERSAFVLVETNCVGATSSAAREDDWLMVTGEVDQSAVTTKDFGIVNHDAVGTCSSLPPVVLGTRDVEAERPCELSLQDPANAAEEPHSCMALAPTTSSTSTNEEHLASCSEHEDDAALEPPPSIDPPMVVVCEEESGNRMGDVEGDGEGAAADGQAEEQGAVDASCNDEASGNADVADAALHQLAVQLDQASLARLHERCRDDELLARALASSLGGDVAPPPPPLTPPPYHHHHHQYSHPHPQRRSRMPQLAPAGDDSATCKCLGASKGFHRLDCPQRR